MKWQVETKRKAQENERDDMIGMGSPEHRITSTPDTHSWQRIPSRPSLPACGCNEGQGHGSRRWLSHWKYVSRTWCVTTKLEIEDMATPSWDSDWSFVPTNTDSYRILHDRGTIGTWSDNGHESWIMRITQKCKEDDEPSHCTIGAPIRSWQSQSGILISSGWCSCYILIGKGRCRSIHTDYSYTWCSELYIQCPWPGQHCTTCLPGLISPASSVGFNLTAHHTAASHLSGLITCPLWPVNITNHAVESYREEESRKDTICMRTWKQYWREIL